MGIQTVMDNYFLVVRHLFNQSLSELKNRLMLNVWSFMALVLVLSFSGSVFSTLVVLEKYHVDSIEQLVETNSTNRDIFILHNGWVWWQFESHKNWNLKLILGMNKMIPRLKTIKDNYEDYENLNQVLKNGHGVLLCDINNAYWRKYLNPGIDYVIGDEKYGYSLSAVPVNGLHTETRITVFKILQIMVETGLNVRSDLRQQLIWELAEQRQRKRTQTIDNQDRSGDNGFDLSFIQQLLLWMSFGYTIGVVSLIYEMIFNILWIFK